MLTVLNEVDTLDALLESVMHQTRPPDEVVAVDGGSSDGTWQLLQSWTERLPLCAIRMPDANIAAGRNRAVLEATGDILAVTDAGVRLDPHWLERLLDHLDPEIDVVSGFFRAEPRSAFELALAATTLPDVQDVRPDRFLPSSRSLLVRRAAFNRVGGYPEWLDYGEDLVFDLALKQAGARFVFAPDAVAWFQPRPTLAAHARQYFLYARGDGKANLWPLRHAVRYASYGAAAALVLLGNRGPLAWGLLAAGAAVHTARPYQRLVRLFPALPALTARQRVQALALVPLIRAVGDGAKILGYPAGVFWRWRHPRAAS